MMPSEGLCADAFIDCMAILVADVHAFAQCKYEQALVLGRADAVNDL